MLLTGFFSLLRLGELTVPDSPDKRSSKKICQRLSLQVLPSRYSFLLPYHKADRFYEGNTVLIDTIPDNALDPLAPFRAYLDSRDHLFPLLPGLWLTAAGETPTYSWFVQRLQSVVGPQFAGHSLRSGGATDLAISGVSDDSIQVLGRWSSEVWCIYIRKHPALLHALVHGNSPFASGSVQQSS